MRMVPPTAIPPRIRDRTNTEKFPVVAESSAETVNNNAVSIRTFFRPKASLKKPASAFPPSAPQPRQLTAQPSFRSPLVPVSAKYFLMNGTAPEITVASNPKRNPPIATISATDTVYNLPCFIMPTVFSARIGHDCWICSRLYYKLAKVSKFYFALILFQDETAGIYLNETNVPALLAGQLVEVEGFTSPGEYAPIIVPGRVRI